MATRRQSSFLSGGEQQMVAIGRMLTSDPEVMLLDEPSIALSPVAVDIVVKALLELRKRGASLLLVEQRIDVAVRVCDQLYVMTHGEIVDEITPRRCPQRGSIDHQQVSWVAQVRCLAPLPIAGQRLGRRRTGTLEMVEAVIHLVTFEIFSGRMISRHPKRAIRSSVRLPAA